jgi:peptidoglycan/LPS O-acetylase OafA/YrhL
MRALPMLCLAVVPACVLFLRILSVWTADSFAVRMAATHLRLDALLFGVGIRSVAQYWPVRFAAMERWRGVLLLAGICLWLPHAFEPGPAFTRTIGLTFTYLGAGAFLIAACHTHAASFGSLRRVVTPLASAIAGIGVYSYAIYLWHVTTIGIVERVVGAPVLAMVGTSNELGWLGVVLVASASVVTVGIVASRAVEWPVLRLRERFFPSRTSSSGTRVDAATGGVTPEVAATVGVQGPESQSALSTSVQ